jgi:4-amino-4-deoxy-L-arabinose transferase-like glycosyltransferase
MWTILSLVGIGFILRVGYRLYEGEAPFWDTGYTFFWEMAQSIAAGRGPLVTRVPAYPAFLAAMTLGCRAFLPIVFSQAAIGAGTVLGSALLAMELFGSSAATLAAGLTAIYPYYVVHDTALQETSLFTLVTLLSVLLLLWTWRTGSRRVAAIAGLALGAAVLTRATIAPFALLGPLWLLGKRRAPALVCASVLALTVAPWMVRSYRLTGVPTLTTETGLQLWDGNNPYTFSHYPVESIDRSKAAALDALTPLEQAELDSLDASETLSDAWFWRKGVDYIRAHPWVSLRNGVRKLFAAFGWWPSPRKGFWGNWVYLASYGPIMALGLAAMFLRRKAWREHMIVYALFVCFAAVTAVFFGHTSHRSYLDVYWIVFASGLILGPGDESSTNAPNLAK